MKMIKMFANDLLCTSWGKKIGKVKFPAHEK
jgi:hypothetical protein